MACATGFHMSVVGDETEPGEGVRISGEAFEQAPDSMIVTVRVAEVTGSQPPAKRARTIHWNVPAGSSRVTLVDVVTAASASPTHSSYSEALVTADHENVAGELTLARFTGSCSDGGATNGHVGVSPCTVVVAEAELFAAVGSETAEVTVTVLVTMPLCGAVTLMVSVLLALTT